MSENESVNFRIRDLNGDDRPREKASKLGIQSLTDAELIAILFGGGLPGKSVIQLSQEILRDNDNRLSRLARMSIHELSTKYKGIGPAKAIALAAAFELGLRCGKDFTRQDPQVKCSKDIYDLIYTDLCKKNHEEFWILHLNHSNRVILKECVSRGGIASTLIDIKILMKSAIDKMSSSIIIVHNHPSGNTLPSAQDNQLTAKIKQACQVLEIKLLDHLIFTNNGYFSYNDEGRL